MIMKKKILLLAIAGGLAAASCKKTYECRDQTGTITCEVGASSQSEANSMCNQDSSSPQTATKK
jgi:hypothetical protein